ncbi:MAG TPA: TlpA family protein disulfide reductase, partial [Acidiferrobacteraceae bacterium]|nr:TlpA family protein disulfide reductase [Acidiferrobacteraceae bacterium]HEX19700.1 TlpA family protein disulfide reductase [Acidiferrobacteraceae bacterium]
MTKQILFFVFLATMSLSLLAAELSVYKGDLKQPVLKLKDLNGKIRDLRDYRGQVVMVNFWASWCPPCRIEMPSMYRLKQKMKGKPFTIL